MNNKSAKGFFCWLFWTAFYSVRPRERDSNKFFKRAERTWWPWKKFKPCVLHNDIGKFWNIYLSDELSYTAMRTITVPVHISDKTGKIMGLKLADYVLEESGAEATNEGEGE